jgi:SOS-response transcriptional repressor LexA
LVKVATGGHPGTIQRWFSGDAVPENEKAVRIAIELELGLRRPPEVQIPLVTVVAPAKVGEELRRRGDLYRAVPLLQDRIAAGRLRPIDATELDGYVIILGSVRPDSVCFRVKGDSMLPQFRSDDVLGVSRWEADPRPLSGQYVVVRLLEEGVHPVVTVKQLLVSKDGRLLTLHALNPATEGYPRVLSHEEADHAEWWHVDWWWGHQVLPPWPDEAKPVRQRPRPPHEPSPRGPEPVVERRYLELDEPGPINVDEPVDPNRMRYLEPDTETHGT